MTTNYPICLFLLLSLILMTVINVDCQNMNFTRKVSYSDRIVATTNLNPSALIRKVVLADTTMDGIIDAIAVGPATLLSMKRKSIISSNNTFITPASNWSGWGIRGIESVGYIRDRPINTTRGWYIVANSYDSIPMNASSKQLPLGAIQMVRETGIVSEPVRISTAISTNNYHTIIGRVNGRQVKIIDINNDGFDDYIVAVDGFNSINQKVGILILYRNNGLGQFNTPQIISDTLGGRIQFDIGDCDRNGYIDIAVIGLDSRIVTVFYQERNSTFTKAIIDPNVGIGNNYAITVGNFRPPTNNTTTNKFNSDIFIMGSNGIIGYLATVLTIPPNQDRQQIPDYVWTLARAYTKNTLFTFTSPGSTVTTLSQDYRDYTIKLMDCDGDTIPDIVTILGKRNGIKCFRKLPDNKVIDWYHDMINVTTPKSMDVLDANKDGILDILVYSETDRSIYLHLGRKL